MRAVLVVPCFNEAGRLDTKAFLDLATARPDLSITFVDDGSTDATREVLVDLAGRAPDAVEVLALERNQGKGEAVRLGLEHALVEGASVVGYADADLSTPPDQLLRVLDETLASDADVVLGSRWKHLGSQIERHWWRHYLGRVFATAVSVGLRLEIYDSQCGAKFFRSNPTLSRALAESFRTRWVFDVELIGRLLTDPTDPIPPSRFREIPLDTWTHVGGSKLGMGSMLRAAADLSLVLVDLQRRRIADSGRAKPGRLGRGGAAQELPPTDPSEPR